MITVLEQLAKVFKSGIADISIQKLPETSRNHQPDWFKNGNQISEFWNVLDTTFYETGYIHGDLYFMMFWMEDILHQLVDGNIPF